jgi:tRNA (guanine-N7-)-methyltransferase
MENQDINILTDKYCLIQDVLPPKLPELKELDLGCGKGSFSTQLALLYPERYIMAADIMIGRLRKLAKRNGREGVDNFSVLRVEARHLLGYMIPDNFLDRLHILCPDPWPKDRHAHNRLLCSDFIKHIYRVLKPNGIFHFATDDIPYYEQVTGLFEKIDLFSIDNDRIEDIKDIKSDFEKRWNEQGKEVKHIAFIKK